MYDRPKGNFSFLIAFAKQLAQALDSHADDDVGIACESLHASLAVLDAICGEGVGGDDGSDAESLDSAESPGDDTPLGAALARIAELERGAPAVVEPRRRVTGGAIERAAATRTRRVRRDAPVLKRGKRRGTK